MLYVLFVDYGSIFVFFLTCEVNIEYVLRNLNHITFFKVATTILNPSVKSKSPAERMNVNTDNNYFAPYLSKSRLSLQVTYLTPPEKINLYRDLLLSQQHTVAKSGSFLNTKLTYFCNKYARVNIFCSKTQTKYELVKYNPICFHNSHYVHTTSNQGGGLGRRGDHVHFADRKCQSKAVITVILHRSSLSPHIQE